MLSMEELQFRKNLSALLSSTSTPPSCSPSPSTLYSLFPLNEFLFLCRTVRFRAFFKDGWSSSYQVRGAPQRKPMFSAHSERRTRCLRARTHVIRCEEKYSTIAMLSLRAFSHGFSSRTALIECCQEMLGRVLCAFRTREANNCSTHVR